MAQKRILVVGAGFAGVLAARRMAKTLRSQAKVTLINAKDHFLFAPRLIDLLEDPDTKVPYRADLASIAKRDGFTFLQATVTSVKRDRRIVTIKDGDGKEKDLPYDHAVICPGARTNYYHIDGAEENSFDLKDLDSIKKIHARVQELITDSKATKSDTTCRSMLTFVVVGGGASGIEAAFALKNYCEKLIEESAPECQKFLSFVVAQAAPQLLPGFPDSVVDGAVSEITRHGVSVMIGEPVTKVENGSLTTARGGMLPAGLILWCAGLRPVPITFVPETAHDHGGFLVTDRNLAIDERTFAAGDAIMFRHEQVVAPKNGQTAEMMGMAVADNVIRSIRGQSLKPFHYWSKGTILTLGHTGYIDLPYFIIKTKLAIWLRDRFYRRVFRKVTGL